MSCRCRCVGVPCSLTAGACLAVSIRNSGSVTIGLDTIHMLTQREAWHPSTFWKLRRSNWATNSIAKHLLIRHFAQTFDSRSSRRTMKKDVLSIKGRCVVLKNESKRMGGTGFASVSTGFRFIRHRENQSCRHKILGWNESMVRRAYQFEIQKSGCIG